MHLIIRMEIWFFNLSVENHREICFWVKFRWRLTFSNRIEPNHFEIFEIVRIPWTLPVLILNYALNTTTILNSLISRFELLSWENQFYFLVFFISKEISQKFCSKFLFKITHLFKFQIRLQISIQKSIGSAMQVTSIWFWLITNMIQMHRFQLNGIIRALSLNLTRIL